MTHRSSPLHLSNRTCKKRSENARCDLLVKIKHRISQKRPYQRDKCGNCMLPITNRDSHRNSSQSVLNTALKLLRRRLRLHVRRNRLRIALLVLFLILWVAAQRFLQAQVSHTAESVPNVVAPPTHRPSNSTRTLAQYISTGAPPS